ncbi:hypothetical protein I5Q83_14465 [Enterocloster clostridioformis]|uniref:hypothetical protein n=1 Tax=Enterocloster clostridioformis TaxID=1531 RepID=UPI0012F50DA4|nr:hypothetical protein [Enterocloster clostridioformis]NDO30549.1 hypothetical protein [Enterocloster clostridioformis]QQR03293.1 hypothetical protein I5Q83_14465 [Enterocloster clostridioformis]
MKEELLWTKELADLHRIDTETYQMILERDDVSVDEFCKISFTVLEYGFCDLFIELIKQHHNLIHNDQYQEMVKKAFIEGDRNFCKDIFDR